MGWHRMEPWWFGGGARMEFAGAQRVGSKRARVEAQERSRAMPGQQLAGGCADPGRVVAIARRAQKLNKVMLRRPGHTQPSLTLILLLRILAHPTDLPLVFSLHSNPPRFTSSLHTCAVHEPSCSLIRPLRHHGRRELVHGSIGARPAIYGRKGSGKHSSRPSEFSTVSRCRQLLRGANVLTFICSKDNALQEHAR